MHTKTKEILARLVAFDTVSRNSNLPLIEWVESYLADHGIASARVPNADGTKANLYATVGPGDPGGVVLSGHTDVVPVDGQDWSTDPFTLIERDGRLYGRGAVDMKAFLAIALARVPAMVAAGLRRPIHLAMTYDEEVSCLGAPDLIARMAAVLPPCEAAIIGEPTGMKTVTGNKGIISFDVTVNGYEVHSSRMLQGASAVMAAARIVAWCDAETRRRAAAATDNPFDPPYTTLHVGRINGGTAHNITAKTCTFEIDIRPVPTEPRYEAMDRLLAEIAKVDAELKAIHPDAGITFRKGADTPGLAPEQDGAAERLVRSLTGDNGVHTESYAAEAGQYQEGGFSAVLCGPGSIAQAHQPDEFIEILQLQAGEAFVDALIERQTR